MKPVSNWTGLFLALFAPALVAAEVSGQLEWAERVALSVPVSGVVGEVPVVAGQAVEAGAVLLRLDERVFKAAVARDEAQVKALAGARAEAQRELERAHELYDRTVLSDRDLQLADLDYQRANASYQSALAALAQSRFDLAHARIEAPYPAWVLAQRVMPGEVLVQNETASPLVIVARRGVMQVRPYITAQQLAQLQIGTDARVTVDGNTYPGKVRSLDLEPLAESNPPRYAVTVQFSLPQDLRLPAGAEAEVELP